jgi:peptidyl-dipeptidase A
VDHGATVAVARAFIDQTERELVNLTVASERSAWVKYTYITSDTSLMAAQSYERVIEFIVRKATEANRFRKLELPPDIRRKLDLLRLALNLPAPNDAKKRTELASLEGELTDLYGKGKYCSAGLKQAFLGLEQKKARAKRKRPITGDSCLDLGQLSDILAKSRDANELLQAWRGWRTIAQPMRPLFERYVALANEGARNLGFQNLGDLWKSRYDMSPADFEQDMDRLWIQVQPLYRDLHCYVRSRLQARYGKKIVPSGKPIPAHLLGNMWSQDWAQIQDILLPKQSHAVDLDGALRKQKVDEIKN